MIRLRRPLRWYLPLLGAVLGTVLGWLLRHVYPRAILEGAVGGLLWGAVVWAIVDYVTGQEG